ncbi:MAG: tRNA lysidine(34) synthetase TilS [Planctomycetaceae bacterium]|nr:tRNA lysidine(34) synthetase TilS [Planctomycetaceae bacterium]
MSERLHPQVGSKFDPGVDPKIDRERVELVASRSPLAELVERRLEACGIRDDRPVLVAVSGGVDSTALLAIAAAIARRRRPRRMRPVVGHVDHALRSESSEDAIAVGDLAAALDLPFRSTRLDWSGAGVSAVSSSAARDARWLALVGLAIDAGAEAVLAAHHADDQAETVLLRLARGTGLDGLSGIPEQRTLGSGCRVVRPLLTARRDAIASLVETAGLPVRHDPTNDRRDRAREMIRHDVLPRLESIHPGAGGRIAAVATEARGVASIPGLGPPPWRREIFEAFAPSGVGALIRAAAIGLEPAAASTPRATWDGVVRMLLDDDPAPRRIRIAAGFDFTLGRGMATFEHRDAAPNATVE